MGNLVDDNSNWIWGIFYYNKDDTRIFPPKRIPWMGWTVNFANTKSVLIFILLMAILGIIIYILQNRL